MYGKLFESTFTGSMYGAGPVVFAVWGYAIAHTKPDSMVELNPKMVAGILGCGVAEVTAALEYLCSDDASSRTKEEGGRRLLQEGEFLYRTVNFSLYNNVKNEPQRREYNRIKQQESRRRRKEASNDVNPSGQLLSNTHAVSEAVTEPPEKNPDRAAAQPAAPNPFDEIRAAFPKRAGSHRWQDAARAYRARIAEGATHEQIKAGVERYAAYVRAVGKAGTEYVQQCATFLGRNRQYLEPWTLPPTKAQVKQDANIAASLEWLESKH